MKRGRTRTNGRARRGARAVAALLERLLVVGALLAFAPITALAVYAALLPRVDLAAPRAAETPHREDSVRITDRDGALIREVRADDGRRARRVPLSRLGARLPAAVLAAEDKRFYAHAGVDLVAVARAAGAGAAAGRIVSGASTITQQLARSLTGDARDLRGKLHVMAVALRLEAEHPKERILEEYLNRVEFGPNVRGAEAAAELYFGKPCAELSLAEAAALASVPRGPTLYDPRRRPHHLLARRDRVLDRMASAGFATAEEVGRAKGEPITLSPRFAAVEAPHFASAVLRGALGEVPGDATELQTTLVAALQAEALEAARQTLRSLEGQGVSAASVVVLDNHTGDILAYVGSPDAADVARLGANDGVLALRQPGSALKPFVYELAMERARLTPASVLPDIELSFPGPDGSTFRPRNYDGRFHGPVTLRDALGNSYNIPAVHAAERVGVRPLLDRLRALGFSSLRRDAEHYGLALALGDGEVRLLDLAGAYATLARGGLEVRPRALLEASSGGGRWKSAAAPERRVLSEREAYLVTHVLSDPAARLASFGDRSALDLPFEVAVKTGTSKGYRDNVTVGYTPEVTVAVWVGNFDGSPMRGVSGVTGAGPLFRAVMLAAARHRPSTPFVRPAGVVEAEVCSLSGHRPTEDCPHRRREVFVEEASLPICAMHERALFEVATGDRAGPGCPPASVEERVVEVFPALYAEWAEAAGRLAPAYPSPRCPPAESPRRADGEGVRVLSPRDGDVFHVEPGGRLPTLRVKLAGGRESRLFVDGREVSSPILHLHPGTHHIEARRGGARDAVTVSVME